MSGEDKALTFFGPKSKAIEAFNILKNYLDDICSDVHISIQGSLLAFKSNAGFVYVSLPSETDSHLLFNLAITTRKKLSSSRILRMVQPIPGTPSYVYHIGIRSLFDIDSELKSWVRQSYEYSKLHFA